MQGAGKLTTRAGDEYEGSWRNGKMHGFGIHRFADKARVYEGFFGVGPQSRSKIVHCNPSTHACTHIYACNAPSAMG
jgi:hypothetical protein